MHDFKDLWLLLTALKSSILFVVAATILFDGLLASLVNWIEHYLTAPPQERGADDHGAARQWHARVGAMPGQPRSSLKPDIAQR